MVEQTVTIQNRLGLHARACSVFVKEAAKFASHVFVGRDGLEVNGKSILGVMMLAAEMGAKITIKARREGRAGGPGGAGSRGERQVW